MRNRCVGGGGHSKTTLANSLSSLATQQQHYNGYQLIRVPTGVKYIYIYIIYGQKTEHCQEELQFCFLKNISKSTVKLLKTYCVLFYFCLALHFSVETTLRFASIFRTIEKIITFTIRCIERLLLGIVGALETQGFSVWHARSQSPSWHNLCCNMYTSIMPSINRKNILTVNSRSIFS